VSVAVPDVSRMLPVDWYVGEDDAETAAGAALMGDCAAYLSGFDWCATVLSGYVGLLIPPVLGVALFEIDPLDGADPWIWVVGGDVPFAYLEFDDEYSFSAVAALERYVENMEDWAAAVSAGEPIEQVFPIDTHPTLENAELLRHRLAFITQVVIPEYRPVRER
jgi:hypothetical protein